MGVSVNVGMYVKASDTGAFQEETDAPSALAALHPGLARDVEDFGPWTRVPDQGGRAGGLWQGRAEGPGFLLACPACASTQDLAFELIREGGLPVWGGVLAGVQTSGRGQLRRAWTSSPGNMHLSLRWPRPGPGETGWDPILPLAAGYSLIEALEGLGLPVVLKWPNDVLLGDRKLGGMLLEDRGGEVVAGFGLNLDSAPSDQEMRQDRAVEAACLREAGHIFSPLALAWALVNRLRMTYENLLRRTAPNDFLPFLSRRMAWVGRQVRIGHGRDWTSGFITGLSGDGGLVLHTSEGPRVFHSGSVIPLERA